MTVQCQRCSWWARCDDVRGAGPIVRLMAHWARTHGGVPQPAEVNP